MNCRVDIQEDIKSYQDTNSVGEGIYILPSDMNLNIKAESAGYNNEILGRNALASEKSSHRAPIAPKHAPVPKALTPTPASEAKLMHKEAKAL